MCPASAAHVTESHHHGQGPASGSCHDLCTRPSEGRPLNRTGPFASPHMFGHVCSRCNHHVQSGKGDILASPRIHPPAPKAPCVFKLGRTGWRTAEGTGDWGHCMFLHANGGFLSCQCMSMHAEASWYRLRTALENSAHGCQAPTNHPTDQPNPKPSTPSPRPRGEAMLLDYSATKGGIVAFTRALAMQLTPKGG